MAEEGEKKEEGGGDGKGGHSSGGGHRKKHGHGGGHHEEVNLERWLVSYADFMTLLFCLFVMLYAISIVDQKKLQSFAQGVVDALGSGTNTTNLPGNVDINQGGGFEKQKDMLDSSGREIIRDYERKRLAPDDIPAINLQQLADYLELILKQTLGAEKAQRVTIEVYRGVAVKVKWPDSLLFLPGNREIDPQIFPALEKIGDLIFKESLQAVIEGVTDHKNTTAENSSWELASKKALVLLHYFVNRLGVNPAKLSVAGRGAFTPSEELGIKEEEIHHLNYVTIIFPGPQ